MGEFMVAIDPTQWLNVPPLITKTFDRVYNHVQMLSDQLQSLKKLVSQRLDHDLPLFQAKLREECMEFARSEAETIVDRKLAMLKDFQQNVEMRLDAAEKREKEHRAKEAAEMDAREQSLARALIDRYDPMIADFKSATTQNIDKLAQTMSVRDSEMTKRAHQTEELEKRVNGMMAGVHERLKAAQTQADTLASDFLGKIKSEVGISSRIMTNAMNKEFEETKRIFQGRVNEVKEYAELTNGKLGERATQLEIQMTGVVAASQATSNYVDQQMLALKDTIQKMDSSIGGVNEAQKRSQESAAKAAEIAERALAIERDLGAVKQSVGEHAALLQTLETQQQEELTTRIEQTSSLQATLHQTQTHMEELHATGLEAAQRALYTAKLVDSELRQKLQNSEHLYNMQLSVMEDKFKTHMEGPRAKMTEARFFSLETRVRGSEVETSDRFTETQEHIQRLTKLVEGFQHDQDVRTDRLLVLEHEVRDLQPDQLDSARLPPRAAPAAKRFYGRSVAARGRSLERLSLEPERAFQIAPTSARGVTSSLDGHLPHLDYERYSSNLADVYTRPASAPHVREQEGGRGVPIQMPPRQPPTPRGERPRTARTVQRR
eukprot:TRINITY_DN8421_c0_g1_i1.p2 TRINITY_DN8421_c0_g1~~TRINITY_DN8421_c0_g1_i1.p2  ORF type:complete len:605 (+),score=144.54 TRINITY_DN8421_c0_g1_i1:1209-3023(+)